MTDIPLDRRRLLTGAAAGTALIGLSLARPAAAAKLCQDYDQHGWQQCESGISTDIAETTAATVGSQQADQWCWAACIEMVFRFHGFGVPQHEIVRQTWGDIVNMPGHPDQILDNLNRPWTDERGRRFRVMGDTYTANEYTAAQDLTNDMPLIIGTMGHAMVLTSILYNRDRSGNGEVVGVVVRDPWPGVGRRQLSGEEWYYRAFLARVRVYAA